MSPRLRRWLRILLLDVLVWAVVAVILAGQGYLSSAYRGRPSSWSSTLAYSFSFYAIWALLTPMVLWLAARVPLARRRLARSLAVHVAASVACALLQGWVFAVAFWPEYSDGGRLASPMALWQSMLVAHFHSNLLVYWVIVGGALALDYRARFRERELGAARLESRLARAELQALKAQFHPHFLFNTLNTISALVRQEPLAAERMVSRLGELLRTSVDSHPAEEVPLEQELDFIDRYLEIEETRFGDRLRVERRIDASAREALVPHLLLQPLVENALRHGVAPIRAGATVTIRAERRDATLHLEVRDDGAGAPPPLTEGVGLASTRARLEHLYGDRHAFCIEHAPGRGFSASIELPLRTRKARP
jgi:two-component system LytT family sensor kinase